MAGPAFLTFAPFTETDWYGFSGAGSDAEIGYCGDVTYIVCRGDERGTPETWCADVLTPGDDFALIEGLPNVESARALCAYVAARGGDPLSAAAAAGFQVARSGVLAPR